MKKSKKEWKSRKRVNPQIPFGYKVDREDNQLLLPIPDELDSLEEAKEHLKLCSYREVARWLSQITGRRISHVGLYKRVLADEKEQMRKKIRRGRK